MNNKNKNMRVGTTMFKNLTISKRLVLSSVFMGILSASIILMLIRGIKSSSRNFTSFLEGPYSTEIALSDSKINILMISTITKEFILTQDDESISNINTFLQMSINDLENSLLIIDKYKGINKELVNSYKNNTKEYINLVNKIASTSTKNNREETINLIMNNANVLLETINNEYNNLSNVISENILSTEKQFIYDAEKIALTSFILFILAAITIVFVLRKTRLSIITPLFELERVTEEIDNGNISVLINYKSKDEIGIVCNKLQTSMHKITQYILDIERLMGEFAVGNFNIEPQEDFKGDFSDIKNSINNMIAMQSEAFKGIQIASDEVYIGAEQVSNAAQSLAQGATQQASSIEELSASISEISYQVKQNAENAQKSNDMSHVIGTKIQKSNEQMQQMIEAMQSINIKSAEIGKIIKTIDDIAFQTNILALNAAVEAARAGTAGKGFAVVADEVRNLASKSAEAAKNTTALIEDSINAVQNGSDIANQTAESLVDVVSSASEITLLIQEISNASIEQSTFIEQVNIGVDQISAVVQTNSATSQESAAASEELSGQSNILKSLVKKFHIKEDEHTNTINTNNKKYSNISLQGFGSDSKY